MKIEVHHSGNIHIAEVIADEILIKTPEDGLQVLVDLYYQDFDKIIVHEKKYHP